MAKVAFNKLGLKMNQEIKTIEFNGQNIEIKQYLPTQEKLQLIGNVITQAHEQDNNYSNPIKIKIFTNLELISFYTNISFSEKQRNETPKTYDLLSNSGVMEQILNTIPESERLEIDQGVKDSVEAIYKYQNSILGIFESLKTTMEEQAMIGDNIIDIQEDLEDLQNNSLLKDIIPLVGLN